MNLSLIGYFRHVNSTLYFPIFPIKKHAIYMSNIVIDTFFVSLIPLRILNTTYR